MVSTLPSAGLATLIALLIGYPLAYLLVPIAIIIVFSFNQPRGRFNFIWQEFSLNSWKGCLLLRARSRRRIACLATDDAPGAR